MQINISGSRCVTCHKYTQYYRLSCKGDFEAIDCGYCGTKSKNVRPGDKCKEYMEKSNVLWAGPLPDPSERKHGT